MLGEIRSISGKGALKVLEQGNCGELEKLGGGHKRQEGCGLAAVLVSTSSEGL